MTDPSAPPISPHEESPPPPPYSEVVCRALQSDDTATQTPSTTSHRAVVIYSVLAVALALVVVFGCIVGDLWFRLDSLHGTVAELNIREEVETVKTQMKSLFGDMENITKYNGVLRERLENLEDKVDRLQLQKEGQLHYVLVAKAPSVQPGVLLLTFLSVWMVWTSLATQF